jgi:peptide/nickel transport system permease protein
MPFLSIFMVVVGGQAIGMRSMCIYELGTDYVKYAKLLGIKENKILLYTFRNAMLPQLTGLALALGAMVGGALITEIIFSYPGLGMAILTAIQGNDYPVITGCTLLITVCVLIANFSVDILVGLLDPRIRAAQAGAK